MSIVSDERNDGLALAALFFLVSLALSAVVFFILPDFFPAQFDQYGYLKIQGDSALYHKMAASMVGEVRLHGFSAFKIWGGQENNHPMVGVMGLLYLTFGVHAFLPVVFNCMVHGINALILHRMLKPFRPTRRAMLTAFLLLLLLPTPYSWVTQALKDGMFLMGTLLVSLYLLERSKRNFFSLLAGITVLYFVRPHTFYTVILFLFVALSTDPRDFRRRLLPYSLILLAFFAIGFKKFETYSFEAVKNYVPEVTTQQHTPPPEWRPSALLPHFVDDLFYRFSIQRAGNIILKGNSYIDDQTFFNDAWDVILYAPKGFINAMAGIFFLDAGPKGGFYWLIMCETLVILASYVCLAWAFFKRICQPPLLGITIYMALNLVCSGLVIVNFGTLHRITFPYLLPLTMIGFLFLRRPVKA